MNRREFIAASAAVVVAPMAVAEAAPKPMVFSGTQLRPLPETFVLRGGRLKDDGSVTFTDETLAVTLEDGGARVARRKAANEAT